MAVAGPAPDRAGPAFMFGNRMGKGCPVFKVVARSFATVAIVGVTSFAMPVAATADTSVKVLQLLVKAASFGGLAGVGVKAAAPAAVEGAGMACAAALPVCAGVAVAVVGAALYMTQDTWVPWFTGGVLVDPSLERTGPHGSVTLGAINRLSGGIPYTFQMDPDTFNQVVYSPSPWTSCLHMPGGERWSGYVYPSSSVISNGGTQAFVASNCWATAGGGAPNSGWELVGFAVGDANTGRVTWGEGVQQVPPAAASLEVQCTNPDGSQYGVTSAVPAVGDLVKMPTCTGAPGDLGGAHGKCVTLSAGSSMSQLSVQSSNCVVAAASDTQYPNCAVGPGCAYMVIVDGVPCTVGRPGCSDWTRTYTESPGRVGCRYGEYAVRVSSCFFLERIYEASGAPVDGTLANTDGNPATWTGDTPAPLPAPGTAPIPNGAPGGAPGTLPGGGVAPLPSPGSNPQTNGDCWSGGSFSWNPVDWVMVPVKCALSWAFVPSTTALSTLSNTAKADLSAAGIAPVAAAVGANFAKVGQGSGCLGPAVTFSAVGVTEPMHPFAACTSPMSTLASISYAMTTIAVVLGGGWILLRAVGEGFGFHIGSLGRGGGSV